MRDPATLPRSTKATLVFVTDGLLVPLALWMAFGFRLGPLDPSSPLGLVDPLAWLEVVDVLVIWVGSLGVLAAFRLYKIQLHAMDLYMIQRLALCSVAMGLLAATAAFFMSSGSPRSIPILFGASFFLLAVTVRIVALRFLTAISGIGGKRAPVAIYGAGAAGIQLAASLKQSRELQPVMFVDDNPSLHNVIVGGIRVKPFHTLHRAAKENRIKQVLIAIPTLPAERKEKLVREMSELGCTVKVVPSYVDLVSGKADLDSLIRVDTEQLLGRDRVDLDIPEVARTYADRCVMVTGGGGSIGSELCHQLVRCNPSKIVIFERSEPALYEIERTLTPLAADIGIEVAAILGSVTDRQVVDAALHDHGVDVVFHAAAYKHVPLIETNEIEGARNNILGTRTVVEAASEAGIERFILVSTDKAVRPTNMMGATKRMAELIVCRAQRSQTKTRFSLVRFGNVLGSSGSVVPLFSKQIAAGGPVTVTHPDVTRYFMTIPEAARLVLLAGAYAEGDDLYVLDMGEPVKIMQLAHRMIELSGRTLRDADNPDGDIAIEVVGLRPGEKLYEELLIDNDNLVATPHPKILRAKAGAFVDDKINAMVDDIEAAISERDSRAIRAIARDNVDGFEQSADGASGPVTPDRSDGVVAFPRQRQRSV